MQAGHLVHEGIRSALAAATTQLIAIGQASLQRDVINSAGRNRFIFYLSGSNFKSQFEFALWLL